MPYCEFSKYRQIVNKFYVGAIIQSDYFINEIKKSIKKILPRAKIENDEISNIIINDVIKRDLVDSDEAISANKEYSKFLKKNEKKKINKKVHSLDNSMVEENKEIND